MVSIKLEGIQKDFTEEVLWLSSEGWRGFLAAEVEGPS